MISFTQEHVDRLLPELLFQQRCEYLSQMSCVISHLRSFLDNPHIDHFAWFRGPGIEWIDRCVLIGKNYISHLVDNKVHKVRTFNLISFSFN